VEQIVKIFGERLNNELTREASLKGLTLIAKNQAQTINLQNLDSLTSQFIDLLHKA
jgi:arylamine N-acetyltransferase